MKVLTQNEKYRLLKELGYSTTDAMKLRQVKRDETLQDRIGKSWSELYLSTSNPAQTIKPLRDMTPRTPEERYERKKQTINQKYNQARHEGYTPKEAQTISQWGNKRYYNTIFNNLIVDHQDRKKRWGIMSKKKREFDYSVKSEIEKINKRNGYDPDASYGYGVMYNAYIYGDPVSFWEKNMKADKYNAWIYSKNKKARDRVKSLKLKTQLA